MREILNDRPFEHSCNNGTVFKAERHDFVGGITIYAPEYLTVEEVMADLFEMAAWHQANILKQLNGFCATGISFTLIRHTVADEERRQRILSMPLLEFFSDERLSKFEHSPRARTRIQSCLKYEISERSAHASVGTVRGFLEHCTQRHLMSTPNFGKVSLEVLISALKEEALFLRER